MLKAECLLFEKNNAYLINVAMIGKALTSLGRFELRKHSIGFVGSLNAVIRLSVIRDVFESFEFAS